MSSNQAIALSVGLLVWVWTFLTFSFLEPRILTWITFLTWASFYAAGGGFEGLRKSIASGLVGSLASFLVLWLYARMGSIGDSTLLLSVMLGVLGWFLCAIAAMPLLSCIPASFIGAASFFGAGSPMNATFFTVLASILVGALLGLASQRLAQALTARAKV